MRVSNTVGDYVIRVHGNPGEIDPSAWDELLAAQPQPTPFVRSAYLRALHDSHSAVADTGWQPRFLTLWQGPRLAAACALYLKSHSYGEYVFDWAWADAYQRHGLSYFPKLLGAVPFTPVPGARLLASDAAARQALAHAMVGLARDEGLSSLHVLFVDEQDATALAEAGCMIRHGVQFHWTQDAQDPAVDFAELLQRLHRDKRKKIQQEQRRVREAGVAFSVHEGTAIDEPLWDFFYACYCQTYREHRSTPYLTRDFFARMARDMPDNWVLFVARRDSRPIAASLVAVDPRTRHAYGRYWGALEHLPCLHFDACYYQPLSWCLQQGYTRFEGGAQGEHKMARGLLPVGTRSAHWLADERFAHAVDEFLKREGAHVGAYLDELQEHNPFKAAHRPPSG
jgi:predicted N-acyltransferase